MSSSSTMQSRKEELLAKKAKLAELKRQRELRQQQSAAGRQSIGGESSPRRTAEDRRSEIDSLVSSLIDRQRESTSSPSRSRPSSYYGDVSAPAHNGHGESSIRSQMVSMSTQTSTTEMGTQTGAADIGDTISQPIRAPTPPPAPEYISYSKSVQTDPVTDVGVGTDDVTGADSPTRARRRSSGYQREADEEIRASLRKEIEDEMRATQGLVNGAAPVPTSARFPLRQLTSNELNAVSSSSEFQSFIERSSKVIERALDEEYDLLADYTHAASLDADEDYQNKSSYSIRETLQLYSAAHSKRRMITDLHFSHHFPELLLTSYTKNASAPNEPNGMVLLWNVHAPSRPEYVFHASSDVLTARFSPFHPNLVIGGCYSGQVCIWDTRSRHRNGQPERRTPPSGPGANLGHTHPIFSLAVVGTSNAHNILTADTDGVVCSWSPDMLNQAQEYLYLKTPASLGAKGDDLAPKSMSFSASDPTFFLVGSEEGSIYACHRYDRAGSKAGVDPRIVYKGHTAPIMSSQFHPTTELNTLLLSSSSDWTVKLWNTNPAAAPGTSAANTAPNGTVSHKPTPSVGQPTVQTISPVLDLPLEDLVYDAKWSPNKPSVFAAVTGAGDLTVYDLLSDIEVPVVRGQPSKTKLSDGMPFKSLNKLAWEERQGKQIAVGGLDGVVTLFEVGRGLWCGPGQADVKEMKRMKDVLARLQNVVS